MNDDLIDRLSAGLRPVSRLTVARRLAVGLGLGAADSAVLTWATLGFRPDMAQAALEAMFWVKLAYTLALAGVAIWAVERLARPAGDGRARSLWFAAPVLSIAAFAAWQLAMAPPPMREPMLMAGSSRFCPWCIVTFSIPPFLGLTWAIRGLAPTRLRLTGLMTGLAAGGAGASVYALHCTESAMPFLAVWYTLGVAATGLLGWLAGPRLLRW